MKRVLRILVQVAGLYVFQVIGTIVASGLDLPISGSLIGMLLLFGLLSLNILPASWLEEGATVLLAFLPVFFVPITAGIMNEPSLFTQQGALLILVTIVSTCLLIIGSGHMGQYLARKKEGVDRHGGKSIHRSNR